VGGGEGLGAIHLGGVNLGHPYMGGV